jgi:hypothetical protein
MKAFEVFINGHFVCRAGIGDDGVLTAIVHWLGSKDDLDDTFLSVGGMDSATNEHLDWTVPTIGVGSEIMVRIIETDAVDPPAKRYVPKREGGTGADEPEDD